MSPSALPIPVETLGDWLRFTLVGWDGAAEALPPSAERTALALCVGELLDHEGIAYPSARALRHCAEALRTLPPQVSDAVRATAFGYWMGVAALAELEGDVPLARMALNALEKRISDDAASRRTQRYAPAGPPNPPAWEMRAMIWARRGRLARLAGHIDDAEECYREAARIGRKQHATEALVQAEVGLALLAATRGNHPAVLRRCRALLVQHADMATPYRVHVHQLIAISARKKGRYAEALRHAWYAFEFLDQSDIRRSEVVLNMADIAEEVGDTAAARRAFEAVLRVATHTRIKTPALLGAIRLSLTSTEWASPGATATVLAGYREEATALLKCATDPFDGAALLIGLATISEHEEDWPEWDRLLSAAEHMAAESKLFERQFRIERMRNARARRAAEGHAPRPAIDGDAPPSSVRPTPETRRLIARIHSVFVNGSPRQ